MGVCVALEPGKNLVLGHGLRHGVAGTGRRSNLHEVPRVAVHVLRAGRCSLVFFFSFFFFLSSSNAVLS
jgi:hypothetical protein